MSTPYDGKIAMVHWDGRAVGERSIDEVIATLGEWTPNVKAIWVKTSDGDVWQGAYDNSGKDMTINGPGDLARWVTKCAAAGIDVHAWCIPKGLKIQQEAALIVAACQVDGLKSMILDVEVGAQYFRGGPAGARALAEAVRKTIPGRFHLALNLDARGTHPNDIHVWEWWPFVDSLHPMVYHEVFGLPPRQAVANAFEALAQYDRPIVPMLQAYNLSNADDIVQATDAAFNDYNAPGVSFFRFGTASASEFRAIQRVAIPGGDGEGEGAEEIPEFTNQQLINAFRDAALAKGVTDYWSWVVSAGLTWIANNRQAIYKGSPIDALPGLTAEEKALIKKALLGEPLEPGDEDGEAAQYTNQQVINAFYYAARNLGYTGNTFWDWALKAGLADIAENRSAVYSGPAIRDLPGLDANVKAAVEAELLAMPPLGAERVLNVPWVSQLDEQSQGPNDCGQACVLMLLKYYGKASLGLTVEDLTRIRSGKTNNTALRDLAARFDLSLQIDKTFGAVESLRKPVGQGKPVILLVNYKDLLFPAHLSTPDQGWHWLLIIGYRGDEFVVHDPLWTPTQRNGQGGASLTIARSTLQGALVGHNALY